MRFVLMLLVAGPLIAQAEKPADTRADNVMAALNKLTFTARRPIPASENIFVEDGKITEALYALAREQNGVALPSGQTAKVSKVLLLDKALHVFFAEDKFALLLLGKDNQSVNEMTTGQLLEMARKGIGALFTIKDPAKPPT
jgi:hypothetical protein